MTASPAKIIKNNTEKIETTHTSKEIVFSKMCNNNHRNMIVILLTKKKMMKLKLGNEMKLLGNMLVKRKRQRKE